MDSHYLHWEDYEDYPDPWQLLADGMFCPISKSIGIVYTLCMLDMDEIAKLELLQTDDGDCLVCVNTNLILNWSPEEILSESDLPVAIKKRRNCSLLPCRFD